MSALTEARDHALVMAGNSSTEAAVAAEWLQVANVLGGLQRMDEPPRDWWRFLPCRYCNARRQEPCQATDGLAHRPHAWRIRAAHTLHGTLWLLANYPDDVLGEEDS